MHIPAAITNRRGRLAAIVAVTASLAVPLSAQAATHSATMTVPDFASKTKAAGTGDIPISEWSWDAEAPVTLGSATGGAGAGKAKLETLTVKKPIDATTPLFLGALTTGHRFGTMTLEVPLNGARKVGATTFELHLSNVFVKKDSISGADDGQPTEQIDLAVGAVTETYRANDLTGNPLLTLSSGWNQVLNQPEGEELAGQDG